MDWMLGVGSGGERRSRTRPPAIPRPAAAGGHRSRRRSCAMPAITSHGPPYATGCPRHHQAPCRRGSSSPPRRPRKTASRRASTGRYHRHPARLTHTPVTTPRWRASTPATGLTRLHPVVAPRTPQEPADAARIMPWPRPRISTWSSWVPPGGEKTPEWGNLSGPNAPTSSDALTTPTWPAPMLERVSHVPLDLGGLRPPVLEAMAHGTLSSPATLYGGDHGH